MTATTTSQVTPERILQFAWGYSIPLMIEAAIENRVFDVLDAGPRTLAEVSKETGASERGLRNLMNALVGFQLLAKSDGRYSLTPESAAFLVSTKPSFQGGMFRHISTQLIPKWLGISEVVRTGKPSASVNQQNSGGEFFAKFVEDIFPMSYRAACTLAEALGVAKATSNVSVLDIAAGSGVWSIALAQASPKVHVTAVDWPQVLPVTQKVTARFHVGDRYKFVAGDILEADLGSGHNIATLGHILHSEGEARSRKLLDRVFAALGSKGTIAIQEFLVDEDRSGPPNGLIFAVNMLVNTDTGDTFTLKEIGGWLKASGFVDVRTIEAPGPSPLILATKP